MTGEFPIVEDDPVRPTRLIYKREHEEISRWLEREELRLWLRVGAVGFAMVAVPLLLMRN